MTENKKNTKQLNFFQTFWRFKAVRLTSYVLIGLLLFSISGFYLITKVFSSRQINNPKTIHFHFRQILVLNGKQIDFSSDKYQVPISQGGCTVKLPEEPIHFHDENGQFVHIHWAGITGGQVLKNYGINYIGGLDDILGFRFDEEHFFNPVKVHGQFFAKNEYSNKNLYIYTGDSNNYKLRDKKDFLYLPIDDFFANKTSSTSYLNNVNVLAHEEGDSLSPAQHKVEEARKANPEKYKDLTDEEVKKQIGVDDENLKELNDVKGDLVIYIQDKEPSSDEIKEKFNSLKPLPLSLCGG